MVQEPARPKAESKQPSSVDLSTQLLMKIADELSSIKEELSTLKKELAMYKGETAPVSKETSEQEEKTKGFFDEEEDEKLPLPVMSWTTF